MEFFNSAVDTLQTLVVGQGGALCVGGGINLLEGYGQENPGSKSRCVEETGARPDPRHLRTRKDGYTGKHRRNGAPSHGPRPPAVSYTHLTMPSKSSGTTKPRVILMSGRKICSRAVAVSYTHLDVYKRQ